MTTASQYLEINPAVSAALAAGAPVVALESTIITHGMPYPQNLETAQLVEADVRAQGGVPATIAVFDGKIHVGLTTDQLHKLASAPDAMKLSRADLAFAVSEHRTGSTTVAATMMAARWAGIDVFATGGIGGVHQGAEDSFDISADLQEFSQTDVIVVCAGPKAILDLNKTMEVLETNGVPVVGYGCSQLPAFWSRESDISVPLRLDTAEQIASFAHVRRQLDIAGGIMVANPVPEEDEISQATMADIIDQALRDADQGGVSGKAVTPFLLSRIFELTDGQSLATNIALVRNNARLAADIASALCDFKKA